MLWGREIPEVIFVSLALILFALHLQGVQKRIFPIAFVALAALCLILSLIFPLACEIGTFRIDDTACHQLATPTLGLLTYAPLIFLLLALASTYALAARFKDFNLSRASALIGMCFILYGAFSLICALQRISLLASSGYGAYL